MMQFYLMNLAILRDLKIGRLNLLNVPEMNFLTFWGLSGVELDAKVNVPTGVKKFPFQWDALPHTPYVLECPFTSSFS